MFAASLKLAKLTEVSAAFPSTLKRPFVLRKRGKLVPYKLLSYSVIQPSVWKKAEI